MIDPQPLDADSLLDLLAQQLPIPDLNNLALLNTALDQIEDKEYLVPVLKSALLSLPLTGKNNLSYAVELTKVCLQIRPNHPILLDQLFWLSIKISDYEGVIFPATQYVKEVNTLPLKTFAYYKLFIAIMVNGLWRQMPDEVLAYKASLFELMDSGEASSDPTLNEYLLNLPSSLKYLEDNPPDYRQLQNTYAQYFCRHLQLSPTDKELSPSPRLGEGFRVRVDIFCQPIKSQLSIPKPILKIGYIAHTLRRHSVGFLSRWLIHHHDRDQFKIYIYLIDQTEDDITQIWFRDKADACYNLSGSSDAIAEQIRQDGIDILVDLDSLTRTLTCKVLALKPAPIQATWLGSDASGLPTIDYFIADPYVLPDNAQSYYQETIWRLPQTYLAIDGFEVGTPSLSRQALGIPDDAIVYLTVQAAEKRHPDTIRLQMQVLAGVPQSYLLVKGRGNQARIQDLFLTLAAEYHIAPDRLRFLGNAPSEEVHRANLAIADIILDTFPYNGATTTLEALWLNLPIVTKVGQQFSARNGYTFLINLGITEGIAWTDAEYINWGIQLGINQSLRESVIEKLKKAKGTAPLWNAQQFTKDMESAYQAMWRNYAKHNVTNPQHPVR